MKAFDHGKAVQQIAGAIAFLRKRSNGKVAVTSYWFGGALLLASAVHIRGLAAVVALYDLSSDLDWFTVDAPIQDHFARHDDWATVAGAQKVKAAVPVPMDLHIYDAQHAFAHDRHPDVYNPRPPSGPRIMSSPSSRPHDLASRRKNPAPGFVRRRVSFAMLKTVNPRFDMRLRVGEWQFAFHAPQEAQCGKHARRGASSCRSGRLGTR